MKKWAFLKKGFKYLEDSVLRFLGFEQRFADDKVITNLEGELVTDKPKE
ncbi:MAG: hypothetical protein ACI9UV_000899 [Algoriphagus sp.]|jgi:hypothetical protein|tara:strand:- start:241 stop:387 length:147 start_codon:yes stop_codon:yes gene_type:complete